MRVWMNRKWTPCNLDSIPKWFFGPLKGFGFVGFVFIVHDCVKEADSKSIHHFELNSCRKGLRRYLQLRSQINWPKVPCLQSTELSIKWKWNYAKPFSKTLKRAPSLFAILPNRMKITWFKCIVCVTTWNCWVKFSYKTLTRCRLRERERHFVWTGKTLL